MSWHDCATCPAECAFSLSSSCQARPRTARLRCAYRAPHYVPFRHSSEKARDCCCFGATYKDRESSFVCRARNVLVDLGRFAYAHGRTWGGSPQHIDNIATLFGLLLVSVTIRLPASRHIALRTGVSRIITQISVTLE